MKSLVGINYFSGWWREKPNKWQDHRRNTDWRLQYPERIPYLGQYNDLEMLEYEIEAAAAHGVDYFQFLWYPVHSSDTKAHCDEAHITHLNDGAEHFITAKNSNKLKFTVEYCNHDPFMIKNNDEWAKTCEHFAEFFKHRSYLRVGGKAVFKIHSLHHLYQQCGQNENHMKEKLDILRDTAQKCGAGELLVTIGILPGWDCAHLKHYEPYFDFYSVYMDIPPLEATDTDYEYEQLTRLCYDACEAYGKGGIKYQPYLAGGWNPRPWYDPRPAFKLPTGKQLYTALNTMDGLLEKYPSSGIPCENGRVKAFTLYAWNEFGEGGFIAPTLGSGYEKLEAIKNYKL